MELFGTGGVAMKCGSTLKRSPLARRTPLRARPKPVVPEPGRREWKRPRAGFCDVCGHPSLRLHHHHVYPEALVRRAGGDPWCAENGMFLCALCHMSHHAASRKIPMSKVPPGAIAFTVALIGEDRAADYFARRYEP